MQAIFVKVLFKWILILFFYKSKMQLIIIQIKQIKQNFLNKICKVRISFQRII